LTIHADKEALVGMLKKVGQANDLESLLGEQGTDLKKLTNG
jgi:hypothetical protein